METKNENEPVIRITATELIAEVKKDPAEAKAKYNNKIAIVTGDITKTRLDVFDWIWLNKDIACGVGVNDEGKSMKQTLKESFREEYLRYAVKGNKNVKVKGKITFSIMGKVIMKGCELSIDGLYAQNPDDIYSAAEKSTKLSQKILCGAVAIAAISFLLCFINLSCALLGSLGMLVSGIMLLFAYTFAVGINQNYGPFCDPFVNPFVRGASANTLSSGAEGVNIPAHVGSAGSLRLFSRKLVLSEIYKVSVSPKEWKNVKLDGVAKKFISSSTVFANSIKGVFIQVSLLIPYLITAFIILSMLPSGFVEKSEDVAFAISFMNALIVYIVFNSLFLFRTNSAQIKFAKEVVQNQKNWINRK